MLPTPKLLTSSNFSQEEIKDIGQGEGAYGTFDMAGNAREWVWNIFGGRGLTLEGLRRANISLHKQRPCHEWTGH